MRFFDNNKKIQLYWLSLGVISLLIAGLLSIFIVISRAPILQSLIPVAGLFHKALVIHVDLSVLIWTLSFQALILSEFIKPKLQFYSYISLFCSYLGTILISLSFFVPGTEALMNNYIPVLQNLVFFIGLSLFLFSLLMVMFLFCISFNLKKLKTIYGLAAYSSFLITATSLICFYLTYLNMDKILDNIDIFSFYEFLFWGGGHILQFTYVNLMQLAWILLLNFALNKDKISNNKIIKLCFIINLASVIFIPMIYFTKYIQLENFYINFFTQHMRYFGGIAPSILVILLIKELFNNKVKEYVPYAFFITSIFLFFIGGLIALFIHTTNATIPAHYHGSIVGISLALMGMLLLKLKEYNVEVDFNNKLIKTQPYIYAAGQFLHIMGLAFSGGYGALRKTPGSVSNIKAQAWMGIMGLGGLIAIIGGIMFVIICLQIYQGYRRKV